jgi:hypothetical protein
VRRHRAAGARSRPPCTRTAVSRLAPRRRPSRGRPVRRAARCPGSCGAGARAAGAAVPAARRTRLAGAHVRPCAQPGAGVTAGHYNRQRPGVVGCLLRHKAWCAGPARGPMRACTRRRAPTGVQGVRPQLRQWGAARAGGDAVMPGSGRHVPRLMGAGASLRRPRRGSGAPAGMGRLSSWGLRLARRAGARGGRQRGRQDGPGGPREVLRCVKACRGGRHVRPLVDRGRPPQRRRRGGGAGHRLRRAAAAQACCPCGCAASWPRSSNALQRQSPSARATVWAGGAGRAAPHRSSMCSRPQGSSRCSRPRQ